MKARIPLISQMSTPVVTPLVYSNLSGPSSRICRRNCTFDGDLLSAFRVRSALLSSVDDVSVSFCITVQRGSGLFAGQACLFAAHFVWWLKRSGVPVTKAIERCMIELSCGCVYRASCYSAGLVRICMVLLLFCVYLSAVCEATGGCVLRECRNVNLT